MRPLSISAEQHRLCELQGFQGFSDSGLTGGQKGLAKKWRSPSLSVHLSLSLSDSVSLFPPPFPSARRAYRLALNRNGPKKLISGKSELLGFQVVHFCWFLGLFRDLCRSAPPPPPNLWICRVRQSFAASPPQSLQRKSGWTPARRCGLAVSISCCLKVSLGYTGFEFRMQNEVCGVQPCWMLRSHVCAGVSGSCRSSHIRPRPLALSTFSSVFLRGSLESVMLVYHCHYLVAKTLSNKPGADFVST